MTTTKEGTTAEELTNKIKTEKRTKKTSETNKTAS